MSSFMLSCSKTRHMFSAANHSYTVSSIIEEFAGKSNDVRKLLAAAAVERLFKFLVVVPASSATIQKEVLALCTRCAVWRRTFGHDGTGPGEAQSSCGASCGQKPSWCLGTEQNKSCLFPQMIIGVAYLDNLLEVELPLVILKTCDWNYFNHNEVLSDSL
jgi:hypothetical protein